MEDDTLKMNAFIRDLSDSSLTDSILIKTIQPLTLSLEQKSLILPNNPNNIKKIQIDETSGEIIPGRFKVKCDDTNIIKCYQSSVS